MVLTVEQEKELITLKHKNELEVLKLKDELAKEEHERKLERLEKILEISKAGGEVKDV